MAMLKECFWQEAILTPSCNFPYELTPGLLLTYMKHQLVFYVWHWFSGGVKFGQLVTIWNFGVLQSSQISWDWANTIHTVEYLILATSSKILDNKNICTFQVVTPPPKVWSRCNLSHFETPTTFYWNILWVWKCHIWNLEQETA